MEMGARQISADFAIFFFFYRNVYTYVYSCLMKTQTVAPVGLLHQIADIQYMEPGKLCVMRQGKDGPYYNLQWRENGEPISRYVPHDQVEAVEQNTANHQRFQELVAQYAQEIITRTREERLAGQKKRPRTSSSARRRNSSN